MMGEKNAWLRQAIAANDLTAREVAAKIGWDEASMSRYINHGNSSLSLQRAQRLSSVLGIPLADIAHMEKSAMTDAELANIEW